MREIVVILAMLAGWYLIGLWATICFSTEEGITTFQRRVRAGLFALGGAMVSVGALYGTG